MKRKIRLVKKKSRKILWAIDPKEIATKPTAASLAELQLWAKGMDCEIQPVTILSPGLADMERGLLGSVTYVEAALATYLRSFTVPGLLEGRVVVDESSTRRGAIDRLLQFAKENRTAAIAVSSHGRSGLERIVLGSFAERLLESAPFPVFFLNRGTAGGRKAAPIDLLPTDFSELCHKAFRAYLRSAGSRGAELILFHAIPVPISAAGPMGAYVPEGYMEDQEAWAKREGAKWIKEAAAVNIKARLVVRLGGLGFLDGGSLLKALEEFGATTAVMTAVGGPVSRALLGSPAFDVFRSKRLTCLVYGPASLGKPRLKIAKKKPKSAARAKAKAKIKALEIRA